MGQIAFLCSVYTPAFDNFDKGERYKGLLGDGNLPNKSALL